jgi:hypothetical protein
MRLISTTIIAIGLCFAATGASAGYFDEDQLPKVQAIQVAVDADAGTGCLDNPEALKTEAELVLRQSGIKVVEDDSGHYLTIEVIGFAITEGCVAHISLQTYDFETLADGTFGLVEAANQGTLSKGPKGGFPQQLRETVNGDVSALANEILKARQK